MNSHLNKKKPRHLLQFFVLFIGFSVLLQLLVWMIHQNDALTKLVQEGLTSWVEKIYLLFSEHISIQGNHLIHPESQRYLVVDSQCTALSLIATLIAAIWAMPHKAVTKLIMTILATVLIQIENIVRILHLFNEISQPDNHFDFYHLYVWQFINFAYALVILYYLHKLFDHEKE